MKFKKKKSNYGVIRIYLAFISVILLIGGLITSLDNSDTYSGFATKITEKAQTSINSPPKSSNPKANTQTPKNIQPKGEISLLNNKLVPVNELVANNKQEFNYIPAERLLSN